MASAASLNAAAVIANGQGLATNANLLATIGTYQSQPSVQVWSTIFANAYLNSNVANAVIPILDTITSSINQGHFLIDVYPSNISPAVTPTAAISYIGGNVASVSGTIQNQARGAFGHGIAGFANTFAICQGYASSAFDTIASAYLLQNKTYAQSGLGYTGPIDLITGGVGAHGALIANVVAGWGTMYDVTNINLIADPYVFGQNLLNQGLGTYGNLAGQLSSTGLDTTDITKIPPNTSTTTQQSSTLTTTTPIGLIDLPILANVTTTTTVTGGSLSVITNIYKTITGANLATIMSATRFTSSGQIQTLNDLLDFGRVVDPVLLLQLASLGIHTFSDFTTYLTSRVGQNNYRSWAAIADYLKNVDVPVLNYSSSTTGTTTVLSSSTVSTLNSLTGTGSGPFGNFVMADFLGASAGIPYTANLTTINSHYISVAGALSTAMNSLNQSIIDTYNYYISTGGDGTPESSPGSGDGTDSGTVMTDWVTSNLATVASTLNSLPQSANFLECQQAYYYMLNRVSTEVSNLGRANALFVSASSSNLLRFGLQIGNYGATDKSGLKLNEVIDNLITNNLDGDLIRATISEVANNKSFANDPNPAGAIIQSQAQHIPLSTYLNQNK
jgi:hypothetical protein